MEQGLRGYWYIAAASARLGRRPLSTRVLDQDLVLFRDGQGQPGALLDRCPHRGVPLSLGKVRQGELSCPYHGWRFDRQGHCTAIPSLTRAHSHPSTHGVPSRPCEERDGYVWVWMGDGPPPPLPGIPRFSRFRWRQGTVPMACAFNKGLENNVDICHPFWTHPWTHPHFLTKRITGFQDDVDELRLTDDGFIIFKPVTARAEDPVPAHPQGVLTFSLPDRMTIWFPKRGFETVMVLHFVPTGPTSCRMEWMWTKLLQVGRRVRFEPREPWIFAQDRALLEGSQRAYPVPQPGPLPMEAPWERGVEADLTTLTLRKVLALAASGRWPQGRAELPERRLIRARK